MRRYISIPAKVRAELNQDHLSKKLVYRALHFESNSEAAKTIRFRAMEKGGILVEEGFIPNCRTEHTDTRMIQSFAGGVQVIVNKRAPGVDLTLDGQVVEHFDSMTLDGWSNLLYDAQKLGESKLGLWELPYKQ